MFFMICGVLKNKDRIKPALKNEMVKDAMRHPLSLSSILKLKKQKLINLIFYVIGILPAGLSVLAITILGKRKHVL